MQDGLEPAPSLVVTEYQGAHCGSVERAVLGDYARPERLANFLQGGLTRCNDVAGDKVRIDHGDAEIGEHVGDG